MYVNKYIRKEFEKATPKARRNYERVAIETALHNKIDLVKVEPQYYVELFNITTGELGIIVELSSEGEFDMQNAYHRKALEIVRHNPSRLLSKPCLETGERLYDHSSELN